MKEFLHERLEFFMHIPSRTNWVISIVLVRGGYTLLSEQISELIESLPRFSV